MTILIIVNPAGGDGTALEFVKSNILESLNERKLPYELRITSGAGDAGILASEYINSSKGDTIVLAGGDGTIHEVVNALVSVTVEESETYTLERDVHLVVVPCGTANAFYASIYPPEIYDLSSPHYKTLSFQQFLDQPDSNSNTLAPNSNLALTIARTKITQSSESHSNTSILSIVVTSTSLHASILHTAEELRSSIPGLDRFKVAAQRNISTWYQSTARLLPATSGKGLEGVVWKYDSSTNAFRAVEERTLEGPFIYFVSTVNVDRLEPHFKIMPLYSSIPLLSDNSMDLIVLRPRNPSGSRTDEEEERQQLMSKTYEFFQAAYNGGKHVDLKYAGPDEGNGAASVAEYYRCGGWEWIPPISNNADLLPSRLVCADGTVLTIPESGKAVCSILKATRGRFKVFAPATRRRLHDD